MIEKAALSALTAMVTALSNDIAEVMYTENHLDTRISIQNSTSQLVKLAICLYQLLIYPDKQEHPVKLSDEHVNIYIN